MILLQISLPLCNAPDMVFQVLPRNGEVEDELVGSKL
jgi:hypothetical protein